MTRGLWISLTFLISRAVVISRLDDIEDPVEYKSDDTAPISFVEGPSMSRCSICLDHKSLTHPKVGPCLHKFCKACYLELRRSSNMCPLCRAVYSEMRPEDSILRPLPLLLRRQFTICMLLLTAGCLSAFCSAIFRTVPGVTQLQNISSNY